MTETSNYNVSLESVRFTVASFFAKLRSRASIDTIRPLPTFLGLQPSGSEIAVNPKAFSSPSQTMDRSLPNKLKTRVKANCSYFLSNYVLVAAMTAIVVALMHPGMLFVLAIVYALWTFHAYLIRHEVVCFGVHVQNLMTVQQRFYVLFAITAVVVMWQCLIPAVIFSAISSFIIFLHASLRDTSHLEAVEGILDDEFVKKDDVEREIEEPKETDFMLPANKKSDEALKG
jgi:hypothetical protein